MLSIAMTCSMNANSDYVYKRYWEALVRFGKECGVAAAPVMLPLHTDDEYLHWCADHFDAFLFTGGVDVDPVLYGETNDDGRTGEICAVRDAFELALAPILVEKKKPVLGICRGIQSMNVAIGGSIWQDIHSQCCLTDHCTKDGSGATHHTVHVNGILAEILGADTVETNSYHHQSVKTVPAGVDILAHTEDGVVEAIVLRDHPYFLGVQWHPELRPDEVSAKLFTHFLKTADALRK